MGQKKINQNNIVHAFCHRKPSKYNILFSIQSQIQKKSTPAKKHQKTLILCVWECETQAKRLETSLWMK